MSHENPTDALRLLPVDTGPNFSDSNLPLTMIHAGADAIDRATDDMANYVSGETIDWDSGMMAVAVYRAMLAAAPASPLPEGGGQCSGIPGQLKSPDLDALEKLAESLSTLDSEERDWPLVKIHGRMFHVENAAKAASDGLTSLIAELKEARKLLTRIDRVYSDIQDGNGNHPTELRKVRAFLARNGKGEG